MSICVFSSLTLGFIIICLHRHPSPLLKFHKLTTVIRYILGCEPVHMAQIDGALPSLSAACQMAGGLQSPDIHHCLTVRCSNSSALTWRLVQHTLQCYEDLQPNEMCNCVHLNCMELLKEKKKMWPNSYTSLYGSIFKAPTNPIMQFHFVFSAAFWTQLHYGSKMFSHRCRNHKYESIHLTLIVCSVSLNLMFFQNHLCPQGHL